MALTHLDYDELCAEHGKDLVDRHIELEKRMAGLGALAFEKANDTAKAGGREAGTAYGNALVAHGVEPVAEAIRAFIKEADSGKAGRRHAAVKYLRDIDPQVAAMLALKTIMDQITGRAFVQTVAGYIGQRIESEHMYRLLHDSKGKASKFLQRSIKKATTFRHKRAVLSHAIRRVEAEWTPWPDSERLHLGMKLIEIIMETVGIVETADIWVSKNRSNKYLVATPDTLEWIQRQLGREELMTPQYLPTLIPPRDWVGPRDGGYHTTAIRQLSMIKTRNKNYLSELDDRTEDMPVLYSSINAMQRTGWKINQSVLGVAKAVWDLSVETKGLPQREATSHVQCPKCHAPVPVGGTTSGRRGQWKHSCFEEDEETHRAWKRRAFKVHEANIARLSRSISVEKTLWCAKLLGEDTFYMPYQLDFRGRVYAIPSFNPQGPDLMKALLTFADGKPIEDGVAAGWLAIQVANTFGEDKISLEDRIQWTEDHADMIMAIADDPLGNLEHWASPNHKKPFQSLAACFEWAGFVRRGYGYVSHLPVALDGSCSGIQHFSAMLRDRVGGAAVNLLPSEKPADIYARVAEVTRKKLSAIISTCGDKGVLAAHLQSLDIDREATKRQVMTLPYGSTIFSCRSYTQKWMEKERKDRLEVFRIDDKDDGLFKASQLLSDCIWKSIGEVVISARAAMDWLQVCAKTVAKEGLPVSWVTPVGFPVLQDYREEKARRINSKLGDSIVKLTLKQPLDAIDNKRMASAISPNFVHSMDAAHLQLSVDYGVQNGIDSFAMIHDSFGTHAAQVDLLGACLRRAFVDMYEEHDVIGEFRKDICRQTGEDSQEGIPPVPPRGDLDLAEVLDSDFFFA